MTVTMASGFNLEQVLAALPLAVCVCDAPDGTIRLWNRRAVELWGREPAAGDPDERFCAGARLRHPDGSPLPHESSPMAEVLRTGEARTADVVIERPDGTCLTVRAHVEPLRDPAGRLIGAVNAFQDISARGDAADALRLSEARYRAIVEDQPDLVCRFLADGTLTFANEAYCAYFGLDRRSIPGLRYVPIVHADDLARVQERVASLSPDNPLAVIENRVIRADGAVRWTHWTNRALYDGQGRFLEFQSAGRDITERKQEEQDVARLAAIVASADAAICAMALDGTVTSWNNAAERMFGHTAAEAVGAPVRLIVPEDRAEEAADILGRVRAGQTIQHLETERVAKDGRRVPVALTASPIRDAAGGISGVSIIARDITGEKRAEDDLQGYLRMLERLYCLSEAIGRAQGLSEICEAAVDAIVDLVGAGRASILVFDDEGVMRFKAWRGLSDAYRRAVDGHSPWRADAREPEPILVHDAAADPSLGPLRDVIVAEGIGALGFIPLVYNGRLLGKFMIYYDRPHAFPEDELRLAATVAHHVAFGVARAQADAAVAAALSGERAARAEADAARAEAERASAAKDEFLAMLAHELRNPLGVISTAIAVLDGTDPADPRHERSRTSIRRQTEHLARLLDDLLDVARITRGQIQLHRDVLDLRTVTELAVESQRHRIEAKGQKLQLSLPGRAVSISGDSVRLQQVLGNLLHNASKYTGSGGTITVVLEAGDGVAHLRVRDTGDGIAPDRLEWIFELFTQANPTLAHTEGGLGIGLTVARRLAELHGGALRARSDGPGTGAEFVVQLPLTDGAALPRRGPSEPVRASALRIVVIEDHDDGREMLVTALRLYGHDVVSAATGRDGIDQATLHAPDVVLVDIGLPDIEGYEVALELRRVLGPGVRLIALTGYGRPADRARSEAAGFHEHLLKPVDPFRLLELLQEPA